MTPPLAVAALFEAISEARLDDALAVFAPDLEYSYWDGRGEETAARSVARGPHAVRDVLAAGLGERPELLGCIDDGVNCFVEGRLKTVSGEVTAAFAASLQLNADGLLARYLSFRCPEVEHSGDGASATHAAPVAAYPVLERYFSHLIAGEFPEAASCFSADCLYSHPPYSPGSPRAEFRGRGAPLAGFEARGIRTTRPVIVCCLQRGSDCFIEGVVERIPAGGSFGSSVSLDGDGLIRRYVAFYSASRVPRRQDATTRIGHGADRS